MVIKKYWALGLAIFLFFIFIAGNVGYLQRESHASAVAAVEQSAHNEHGNYPITAQSHSNPHESLPQLITPQISPQSRLPLGLICLPLIGSVLILIFSSSQRARNIISVSTAVISFLIIIAMFDPVVRGITVNGELYKGLFCTLPLFRGFDATFKVDPAALLIAGATVFLWILSTIHAISYMTIEEKRVRYETFVLASLAMNLGVLMAGDFLTLFFFFEGMVIFPYSLIAHKEDKGALYGANMYLYLGVATSLCLFFGIMLLHHFTGSISIRPLAVEINANVPATLKYVLAALMIAGFGGKAGLFFEHIWLPQAHPVAPTPASCLLSGAMIKAGAYGIFRVANMIFIPPDWGATLEWLTVRHVGYALIWMGVITMFFGVLNALISGNSKRMLAYHSVSQMGYIVLGIGCAAYLGADGAMGLAGALYHIVNHALFKASLFLTVGAVYYRTHELDMYKLGGLWRNLPFTCVAMFIAACGIAGIPGFNGFASKTLLHHSILEAYEHSAHYSADGLPDFKLRIAEILFMITAGGTFASNMKLWVFDFLGERPEKYKDVQPEPLSMKIALGLVSVAILFIGLNPNWMLENLIGPALAYFHFNPASHPYHILYNVHAPLGMRSIIPILYNPISGLFFSDTEVVHNLLGAGDAVIFGGTIFIFGLRLGWFHSMVPAWLTVGYYYNIAYQTLKRSCHTVFAKLDAAYNDLVESIILGRNISTVLLKSKVDPELWDLIGKLEEKFSEAVNSVIYGQNVLAVIRQANTQEKILNESEKQVWDELKILSEKQVWDELKILEDKYGHVFDRAIFGHGTRALLKDHEQEKVIWQELRRLEDKYGAIFDKMILHKNLQHLVEEHQQPAKAKSDFTRLWERFSDFDQLKYDTKLDVALFGNTNPEAEPEENWFGRFCRRVSSIHTGDVSHYVSWIVIVLVVVITVLVGKLYISSLLGIILLVSVILFLIVLASLLAHS
ncbi:MAG: hypothetical protein HZA78_07045 [Candidatus Schekmanbacteria bacterium]|nr:hypothetical protein [Candidatus Schekmanbacteria bacterium]